MENLYLLGEPSTVYSQRFKTNILSYPVRFINLDTVNRITDIASEIFDTIVNEICDKANANQHDIIGVTINHFSLHKPIMLPFKKRMDFKGEMLVNLIENVMQSKEELNFDEEMRIQVVVIHLPHGTGRKQRNTVKFMDYHKTHSCKSGSFIKIENTDELCLARAIVTAVARLHKNEAKSFYETILKGDKSRCTLQREKAMELMKMAGLAEYTGPCGLEELIKLQAALPEYQIKLFNAMRLCVYSGPCLNIENRIIYLLHYENHYTIISSMKSFLVKNFYCDTCDKGFDKLEKHRCNVKCLCCYQFGVCKSDETATFCSDCNRYFPNETCFNKHKNISSGRKRIKITSTICDKIKRCKDCGHLIQKNHRCGFFHCKVCNEDVPEKDHLCFMQCFEPKKECKKFVFFDVETRQENILKESDYGPIFRHEINLAIAHTVCINCINGVKCEGKCGEKIFWDRDSFCSWLFSDENRGSTCIAHFMKGFDGQFCLQYLHEQGVLPKITPKGSELMCIYVNEVDIRIIDSINFFNMPLSALPKTFGFDEIKKGYFPHFFNRAENFNYIGPIPDAFDYGPANMKPAASKAFHSWHKDQLKNHVVFDFKKELVDYCRSDVDILKRCCLQFRKDFLAENGIDPLTEAMTIAGACNRVYRQTFLQPHTIGIVPHGGYRRKDVQSVTALKWLKWVSFKENVEIRHAANYGEVRIGPYKVDGLAGNVIYEFLGCFWHGCKHCLRNGQRCADKISTAEEAYQKVQDRRKFLEGLGYSVIEKWGCELDAELKINKEMEDFFLATEVMSPLDPRDAFYGGRTNATKMYHKCKLGEKIHYIDIVSLYPWVNKYGKYVLGHPQIITENFKDLADKPYEGLIKMKILPPRKLLHPLLPCKVQKKLLFSLCKTCAETKQQETCAHSDEERAMTGVWVTDEIYKALSLGYTVLKIYEVWTYEKSIQYDGGMEAGLFGGYVDKFLKLKQEADGWPANAFTDKEKDLYLSQYKEREGIVLEKDKISKNPGRRMLSKIMLNSFWGKFGERSNMTQTEYFTEFKDYCTLLMDPAKVIKGVNFVNENMVAVSYCYEDDFAPSMGNTNVVLAAYTTCQARLKLYSYIEKLQENVLYFDTDSIIYLSTGKTIPTGSFLGDMSNELKDYLPGAFISEFVSAGPKNYSYKVCTHDNVHINTVCKVRGFSLSNTVQKRLNFKSMRAMVFSFVKQKCNNELKFVFPKIERYLLNVVTKTVCKKYRVVYDKRVVKNDFSSLPYGY